MRSSHPTRTQQHLAFKVPELQTLVLLCLSLRITFFSSNWCSYNHGVNFCPSSSALHQFMLLGHRWICEIREYFCRSPWSFGLDLLSIFAELDLLLIFAELDLLSIFLRFSFKGQSD